jgi:cardiolipin synthase
MPIPPLARATPIFTFEPAADDAPALSLARPPPRRPVFNNFGAEYFGALEQLAGSPPDAARVATPLRDGKEALAARLALVASAKTSIVCTTYAIVHDEVGAQFLDALVAAAQRGVHVVLSLDNIADKIGSLGCDEKEHAAFYQKLAALEAAGGFVAWYSGLQQEKHNFGSGDHFKALVADGSRAIMGGRNAGADYVDRWTDFEMQVEGPIAAQIGDRALRVVHHSDPGMKRRLSDADKRRYLRAIGDVRYDLNVGSYVGRKRLGEARARGEAVTAPFYLVTWDPTYSAKDGGGSDKNAVTQALIATFDRASTSITLSSNYVWGVPELQASLIRAARRGVHVTVVTTGEAESPGLARVCYLGERTNYGDLQADGIVIRETTKHEHGKMYLVDDTVAAFGSYNMEYAADRKLVEGLLFTTDQGTVAAVRDALTDTIAHRSQMVSADHASFWTRFSNFFLMLFDQIMHFFV